MEPSANSENPQSLRETGLISNQGPSPRRGRRLVRIAAAALATAAAVALWLILDAALSKPDLRAFDPGRAGALEAEMWRSYYEGRWVRLGLQSIRFAREQHHFPLWHSAALGWHAARAGRYFRKKTTDPRALRELEKYYEIIRQQVGGGWNSAEAARLELRWWAQRREGAPPGEWVATLSRLAEMIFELPPGAALPAATARVEAMRFRDARRDGKMTDDGWTQVSLQLASAYRLLHESFDER